MKPSLAPYRPHEPLMCLVAGSRAWHGGASGGSVRGVASALLSDDEPKAQRATSYLAPRTSHPPPTCHLPPPTSHALPLASELRHGFSTDSGAAGWQVARGPTSIHPTAVVDPGAVEGEGVTIGPYCVV